MSISLVSVKYCLTVTASAAGVSGLVNGELRVDVTSSSSSSHHSSSESSSIASPCSVGSSVSSGVGSGTATLGSVSDMSVSHTTTTSTAGVLDHWFANLRFRVWLFITLCH